MEQLLELLKQQRKEVLQWLILELMKDNKLSFTDIAETHVKYLEMLRKGQSEKLMRLRSEVIKLWCGTKKDRDKALKDIMHDLLNKGRVNTTHEEIDKR